MIRYLCIFLFLTSLPIYAKVKEVTLEVSKIYSKRDPYLPEYSLLHNEPVVWEGEGIDSTEEHWTHKMNLGLQLELYKTKRLKSYLDQQIVGYSTEKQYRKMFWDWELGQTIYNRVDIFWHHKSQHGLETSSEGKYPLEDVLGVRIYLYKE